MFPKKHNFENILGTGKLPSALGLVEHLGGPQLFIYQCCCLVQDLHPFPQHVPCPAEQLVWGRWQHPPHKLM